MEERLPSLPDDRSVRQILGLARSDRSAAERALAELTLEQQLAVVCQAPLAMRARLLGLVPEPEAVIAALPEAEFCFTAKAVGVDDASWLLSNATPSQITACVDLDAWAGQVPDRSALDRWIASLAAAGDDTLIAAAQTLDPELIVLYLRDHVQVVLASNDDDWEPPVGAHTLEGQFYLSPILPNDDIDPLLRMLNVLFQKDYWLYFRMLQGVVWELETELEEWALRWRTGRLEDLGFPSRDEAMRIYGFVRPDRRALLSDGSALASGGSWHLPVWMPELPAELQEAHALFRAIGELDAEERRAAFYAFVALANKLAVADGMDLGDAETLPAAIDKAASVASAGLEWIAEQRALAMTEVVRRSTLDHLFRVGASLDRAAVLPNLDV